jgi:hypothetical protein
VRGIKRRVEHGAKILSELDAHQPAPLHSARSLTPRLS